MRNLLLALISNNLLVALIVHATVAKNGTAVKKFQMNCINIKCPTTESPVCVKLKYDGKKQKDLFIVAINECEINYAKCKPGIEAVIVPMKNCEHSLATNKKQITRKKRIKRQSSGGSDGEGNADDVDSQILGVGQYIDPKQNAEENNDYDDKENNDNEYEENNDNDDKEKNDNEYEENNDNDDKENNDYDDKENNDYDDKENNDDDDKENNDYDHTENNDNGDNEYNYDVETQNIGDGDSKNKDYTGNDNNDDEDDDKNDNSDNENKSNDYGDRVQHHGGQNSDDDVYQEIADIKDDYDILLDNDNDTNTDVKQRLLAPKKEEQEDTIIEVDPDYDNTDENEVNFVEYRDTCPKECPAKQVMVCARCQHNIYRTFLSVCHLRMFHCKHTTEKLELVSRKPCMQSSPYLAELPAVKATLKEPGDEDQVLKFIHCRDKGRLERDPRCEFQ